MVIETLIDHFSGLCPNLEFAHHYAAASSTPDYITITAENANYKKIGHPNNPFWMIMGLKLDGCFLRVEHHAVICGVEQLSFDLNRQEDLERLEEMLVRTNAKAPNLS